MFLGIISELKNSINKYFLFREHKQLCFLFALDTKTLFLPNKFSEIFLSKSLFKRQPTNGVKEHECLGPLITGFDVPEDWPGPGKGWGPRVRVWLYAPLSPPAAPDVWVIIDTGSVQFSLSPAPGSLLC